MTQPRPNVAAVRVAIQRRAGIGRAGLAERLFWTPVLMALAAVSIDVGLRVHAAHAMHGAAHEAARRAATGALGDAQAAIYAQDRLPGFPAFAVVVAGGEEEVVVTISTRSAGLLGLIRAPRRDFMRAVAVHRREG